MNLLKSLYLLAFLSSIRISGQINPTVASSTGNFSLTCNSPTITLTASSSFTSAVTYSWTNPQMIITNGASVVAISPGVYSLSASSGIILETSTISVVTNTTQPSLTLTTGSSSITCNTPTIMMTAISSPTNVSYTWIEPGVGLGCSSFTCIAATPGVFGVTVKDAVNGCQKTTTINIADNRQYPIFSSTGLYTIACPNGTVSLEPTLTTGATNISFQWKIPFGAVTSPTNNLSLITNTPGEYTLTATNTINGCASNISLSVYACVGLSENYQELKINGYPNPISDIFILKMEQEIDFVVDLSDALSQNIFSLSNEQKIDFTQIKPGLYFITVQSSKGRKIFKVVKE